MNEKTQRIRTLVGEFPILVIGIFLALMAEAWWSDRSERAYEREMLEDMHNEFKANIDILISDKAFNTSSLEYSELVLSGFRESEDQTQRDALMQFIRDKPFRWATFDPALGASQAIIESGYIGFIKDRELRGLLSKWIGLLKLQNRYQALATEFVLHHLHPKLSEYSADDRWTKEELSELEYNWDLSAQYLSLSYQNQLKLLTEAENIVQRLDQLSSD